MSRTPLEKDKKPMLKKYARSRSPETGEASGYHMGEEVE
jgi:hypothetical protein